MPRRTRRQVPGQLPMFMSAREIMGSHQPYQAELDWKGESETELWARKASSLPEDLRGSIQREGVQSPVHLSEQFGALGRPQIAEGHSRLSAVDPDTLMPVLHHETPEAAGDYVINQEPFVDYGDEGDFD